MKGVVIALCALMLSGCEDPSGYRNSPHEQVIDYTTCRDGGMRAYLNGYAEIRCAPPEASVKP